MKNPFVPKPVLIDPEIAPGEYTNVCEIEKSMMIN